MHRNKGKADILNQQFQSVFTPLSPLSLRDLSLMKVQDLVDGKVIPPTELPDDLRNSTPVMTDISISEAGLLKLLKSLKPKKAAGTGTLQELRSELVPILKVLFESSIESGAVPHIYGTQPMSLPYTKRVTNQLLPITDPFPLHAS